MSSRPGEEHVAAPGSRSRAERTAPVERADADRPGRAGAPRSGLAARASANRHALALRASASRHALAVRASANRHTLTALAIVTALAVTDALLGSAAMFTGLLVIGPFTASAFVGPGRTALVGVYAAAAAVALGVPDEFFGTTEHVVRCAGVAVGGGLATWVSWRREQRDELLERVARVAEVAQRAILRPLPPVVGAVAFAHRYLSASREARVGGDLYEVVDTVHGVRAVVGDVRGKGLEAVRLASVVLGSFREAAYTQPCLRTVAAAMNVSVARHLRAEDFVTVVLAEFHEGRLRLVNCGHHPPLAWRADKGMEFLVPETTCPPLGLDPEPNVTSFELAAGDRVLFYTDGLVEARDAGGAFLALEDAAHACGDHPSLDEAVDRLVSELLLHVNGQLHDDLALVLAEQLVPDPPAVGAPA